MISRTESKKTKKRDSEISAALDQTGFHLQTSVSSLLWSWCVFNSCIVLWSELPSSEIFWGKMLIISTTFGSIRNRISFQKIPLVSSLKAAGCNGPAYDFFWSIREMWTEFSVPLWRNINRTVYFSNIDCSTSYIYWVKFQFSHGLTGNNQ